MASSSGAVLGNVNCGIPFHGMIALFNCVGVLSSIEAAIEIKKAAVAVSTLSKRRTVYYVG